MRPSGWCRSDAEALSVLHRGIPGGLTKRMGEVGLIGVEIELVRSEGPLQPEHFEQVVRSEAGESLECAL